MCYINSTFLDPLLEPVITRCSCTQEALCMSFITTVRILNKRGSLLDQCEAVRTYLDKILTNPRHQIHVGLHDIVLTYMYTQLRVFYMILDCVHCADVSEGAVNNYFIQPSLRNKASTSHRTKKHLTTHKQQQCYITIQMYSRNVISSAHVESMS